MEPVSGGAAVAIGAVVVVVGFGLWLVFKHYCRLVVSISPVTVAQYASTSITATLERKGWAFGSWSAVVPATYTATSSASGRAGANVTGSPTTAAATSATVTIAGAARGPDNIRITASGADCTNVSGSVPVTVT